MADRILHIYDGYTTGRDSGYPEEKYAVYPTLLDAVTRMGDRGGQLFRVRDEDRLPEAAIRAARAEVARRKAEEVRADKLAQIERLRKEIGQ